MDRTHSGKTTSDRLLQRRLTRRKRVVLGLNRKTRRGSEMILVPISDVALVIIRVMKTLLGAVGVERQRREIWGRAGHYVREMNCT